MKAKNRNEFPTVSCQSIHELSDTEGLQDNPRAAEHLSHCLPCQRYGRELINLQALIKAGQPLIPPHDFNLKLRQRIAANRVKPRLFWWQHLSAQPLFTAAMALVILTFMLTGYQYWPSTNSTTTVVSVAKNPINASNKSAPKPENTNKDPEVIASNDNHDKATKEELPLSEPERPRRNTGKYVNLNNINVEISYPHERQIVPVLQVTYGAQPIVPVKVNEPKMDEVIAQGEPVIF
jgi:hypothetical protein